jgi:glutamate synthase domain-containing protein 3
MSKERTTDSSKSIVYPPGTWVQLDAQGLHYKDLNRRIRTLVLDGARNIEVKNVHGQRYIGTNLFGTRREGVRIRIYGTPGSDLAAFMDGPIIEVFGNVQDTTGNTMNSGRIIVHGSAGDILGYGMRGGEIYVRGNVGYRVGIHMKEYFEKVPVVVIGGMVQDFFGEYMAGGRIIVLNKFFEDNPPARQSYFIGTGMHGGVIYIHGEVELHQIGAEVDITDPSDEEIESISDHIRQFSRIFGLPDASEKLQDEPFMKLFPKSARPYGRLYAY